jgi:hypothetical protein
MKPGYQSSEFWITVLGQILALLALTGAINVGDKDKLETALANAVTAVFTIVSSTVVVIRYVRSRTALKSQQLPDGNSFLPAVLVLLGLLGAAPVHAETPTEKTCLIIVRRPRTDPAVTATLQQLAQNQQTIIALLSQRQQAAPAPQVIVLGPPAQQIPLGGPPRQDIPLGGPRRQDVPLGGQPRQDIPLGTPPRQDIPLGEPKPFQPPPGEAKPTARQQYVPAVFRR